MDTRKLITVIAFLFVATAGFAQTPQTKTNTFLSAVDEIMVHKNAYGKAVIEWSTESKPTLEFLVQGSVDGINFRAIKRVVASVDKAKKAAFQATDESDKGYVYFRIIAIDAAGHYSYSKVGNSTAN